jgi:hypothetical protein
MITGVITATTPIAAIDWRRRDCRTTPKKTGNFPRAITGNYLGPEQGLMTLITGNDQVHDWEATLRTTATPSAAGPPLKAAVTDESIAPPVPALRNRSLRQELKCRRAAENDATQGTPSRLRSEKIADEH